jgi:hypothetical protein
MKCHLSAPLVLYLSHWQGQDGFRQLYTLVICLDTVQTLLMNGDTYLVRIMTSNFSLDRVTCLPSALNHQLHPRYLKFYERPSDECVMPNSHHPTAAHDTPLLTRPWYA